MGLRDKLANWWQRRKTRKAFADLGEKMLADAARMNKGDVKILSQRQRFLARHLRSKYSPHQGEQETARRRRQAAAGTHGL